MAGSCHTLNNFLFITPFHHFKNTSPGLLSFAKLESVVIMVFSGVSSRNDKLGVFPGLGFGGIEYLVNEIALCNYSLVPLTTITFRGLLVDSVRLISRT